jgi:eukaryotic-like serine/threonine-protein kinase
VIGEILDSRYEILRLLGKGGMGAVYEALNTHTGQRVAVKVITGDSSLEGDDRVSRFHREVKAARGIDTPHIAQVLDAGTHPATGAPYLVIEHLRGEDLQQLLKRVGPLPPDIALRIAAQVCVGLQKAHAARVIHRDIKPANLFLAQRDDGEVIVKILDFGIAKIKPTAPSDEETTGITRVGEILGSPVYMSPEQVRGSREIDHRTDLWSLGIVLHRTLSGRVPYANVDAYGEFILAVCSASPPSIQAIAPWIPSELAAVVRGALQTDPIHRYHSAEAMLDAIKPLLPGGFALRQEQLVALGVDVRASVAPKLDVGIIASCSVTQRSVIPASTRGQPEYGIETRRRCMTTRHNSRRRATRRRGWFRG